MHFPRCTRHALFRASPPAPRPRETPSRARTRASSRRVQRRAEYPARCSSRQQLGQEGAPAPPEVDPEPFADGGTEVGEGRALAQVGRAHWRARDEQRDDLPGVVARRRRWIVAVIGGEKEQVVLAQSGEKRGKGSIERAECLVKPRCVVSVPPKLVEIY